MGSTADSERGSRGQQRGVAELVGDIEVGAGLPYCVAASWGAAVFIQVLKGYRTFAGVRLRGRARFEGVVEGGGTVEAERTLWVQWRGVVRLWGAVKGWGMVGKWARGQGGRVVSIQ